MSVQTAVQFITTRVATTPALRLKLAADIHGKSEDETSRVVSDLGRGNGFDFNAEDARQARPLLLAALRVQAAPGGNAGQAVELSPEELDRVAGGTMDSVTAQRVGLEALANGTVSIPALLAGGYSGANAVVALNRIMSNQALLAEYLAATGGGGAAPSPNILTSGGISGGGLTPASGAGPGS